MQRRITVPGRIVVGVLIALLSTAAVAQTEPAHEAQSTGDKVFDACVLRPTGFIAFLVGTAAFVPAAFISSPGGEDAVRDAWQRFVTTPADFVFKRPLGDF